MDASCILHLDLDCYYAQVEHKRLGIPSHVPLAVQQWQGLIAVNYAARAKGVTRFMRIHEALKACPDLQLVHVKTIGVSGEQHGEQGDSGAEGSSKSRLTAKACLSRYRTASSEIIACLRSLVPETCTFEKGGCDEFFFDLTTLARSKVLELGGDPSALHDLVKEAEACSEVQGGPMDPLDSTDLLLAAGAVEAKRLRQTLFERLGYTASAGISSNKLLSKVSSAKFKPNRQALVLRRGALGLMSDVKVKKIWGLGGKIGDVLEGLGYTMAGEAMALSLSQLTVILKQSDVALMVYQKLRGESNDAVTPRSIPKSFASCKSFQATSDHAAIRRWLDILADELASRLEEDADEHSRRAGTMTLHYSSTSNQNGSSVRIQVPRVISAATISSAAYESFKRLSSSQSLPSIRLSLTASDFTEGPRANGRGAITSYFTNQASTSDAPSTKRNYFNVKEEDLLETREEVIDKDEAAEGVHVAVPASLPADQKDAAVARPRDGEAECPDILDGVDMFEQRRIMAEIEIQNIRKRSRADLASQSRGLGKLLKKGKSSDIRGFLKPIAREDFKQK